MSVPKLKRAGLETSGSVPSLLSSMRAGASPSKSSQSPKQALLGTMRAGHEPSKSSQDYCQPLIETMRASTTSRRRSK